MSNEIMTVGSIRTTAMPPSGIYEALLEKAERERDEAREALKVVEQAHHAALYREGELKRECAEACEESREQARLLGKGSEREARLITERDHYKISLESLLKSVDDWNDSMVKEPADDFIAAIAAYITEKLEK